MKKRRRQKLADVIIRMLNSRYSVSTYILNGMGLISGLILLSVLYGPSTPDVIAFLGALPVLNAYVWVYALITTAITKYIGMAKGWDRVVHWSSGAAFVLWIFGAVAFALVGNETTAILIAGPLILFNIYLFLATSFRSGGHI